MNSIRYDKIGENRRQTLVYNSRQKFALLFTNANVNE